MPQHQHKNFRFPVTVECDTQAATVEVSIQVSANSLNHYLYERADMYSTKGFFERKTRCQNHDHANKMLQQYNICKARSFVDAMIGSYYYNL